MYFFWRLYLSHLLADFPFQTDKIFEIKTKYRWGVLLHGSIAGILAFLFSIPYFKDYPLLILYLILLWAFHIFIDKGKLLINPYVGKLKLNPFFFLLDQGFHLLSVYLVSLGVPADVKLGTNIPFYNNTHFIIILGLYIIGTYGIYFFFQSFRTTGEFDTTASKGMKYLEMFERLIIISMAAYSIKLIPYTVLLILPRSFLCIKKREKICLCEIILGLILAILVGIFIFNLRG